MAQVAEALQGLTQYLFAENQRLDLKDKEKRVQLAAEHIADKFQNLPPDASPREMQSLQFELIEDAAALGGLQENLPLITGLYSASMQTRELEKKEREDAALGDIIADEFGVDADGLSGQQRLQLAQLFKQYESEYQTVDDQGYAYLRRFDMHGKEIFNLKLNALGTEEQFGLFKRQALFEHGLQKDLAKFKNDLELAGKGITAIAPELAGKKFLKGQQGLQGELLYEGDGGGLWTINKQGQVVAYDGEVVSRGQAGANLENLVQTLERTGDYFGSQKLRIANQILAQDRGEEILQALIPTFKKGDFTVTDDNDNTVVNPAVLEALDQQFNQMTPDELSTRFNEIYEKFDISASAPQIQALNNFAIMSQNQSALERQIFNQLPETDRDNITDRETWNTGVTNIRKILTDPSIPEDKRFYIQDYIAGSLGLPAGSTVTMNDYQRLTMEQKQDINEMVARNSTSVLYRYQEPKQSVYPPFNVGHLPFAY